MPKIYFVSGKVEDVDVTQEEFSRMILKMQTSGVKFTRLKNGSYVPLNSNTMEIISTEGFEVPENVVAPMEPTTVEMVGIETDIEIPKVEEPVDKVHETALQKENKFLEVLVNKSNCKHEMEKLKLCTVGSKKGVRYFYVCSYCGWRGRFVKAETLSGDQKDNAQVYAEK